MAFTKESIINIGLDRVGLPAIVSVEDTSTVARTAVRHFEFCLYHLLSRYPWGFATKQVSLDALDGEPTNGFAYQFTLPGDFIQVVEVNNSGNRTPGLYQLVEYEIKDTVMYSNTNPVVLHYITKEVEDNAHKLPPYFAEALSLSIAASLSALYEASVTSKQQLEEVKEQAIRRAIFLDSKQSSRGLLNLPTIVRRRAGARNLYPNNFFDATFPWD